MKNDRKPVSARIGHGFEAEPQWNAPRRNPELEWTESEWFQVWLRLAREGQQADRN